MKNSPADFEEELTELINKHSMESNSNTPDFILAKYLCGCMLAWTIATNRRDDWNGQDKSPETPTTAELETDIRIATGSELAEIRAALQASNGDVGKATYKLRRLRPQNKQL